MTFATGFYIDWLTKPIKEMTSIEKDEIDKVNDGFVTSFSEPFARILARNQLSKRYGRKVIDSHDYIAVLVAVWAYQHDLADVRQRRSQIMDMERKARVQHPALPNQPHAPGMFTGEPIPQRGDGSVLHDPTAAPQAESNGTGGSVGIPIGAAID